VFIVNTLAPLVAPFRAWVVTSGKTFLLAVALNLLSVALAIGCWIMALNAFFVEVAHILSRQPTNAAPLVTWLTLGFFVTMAVTVISQAVYEVATGQLIPVDPD